MRVENGYKSFQGTKEQGKANGLAVDFFTQLANQLCMLGNSF